MFKRILAVLLLIIALTACGQKVATWQEQYDLGIRYLSEGNYEEAIIAFTAAIEIDPKQAPAYVGRGDAYVGIAQFEENPESEDLSAMAEENYKKALEDYLTAVDLDKLSVESYQKAAEIYKMLGDLDAATALLEHGLEVTGSEELQAFLDTFRSPMDYIIQWVDPAFERLIRTAIGKPTGDIYCSELDGIEHLEIAGDRYVCINYEDRVDGSSIWSFRNCSGTAETGYTLTAFFMVEDTEFTERGTITSIEDIIHIHNLSSLWIIANHVSDLTPLLSLEHLSHVIVWGNDISDLSVLEQLNISMSSYSNQLNSEQFLEIGDSLPSYDSQG